MAIVGVIFNIIFIIIIILNRNTTYLKLFKYDYLTIIPRAWMGSESIAEEWAINSEAMRARGIIVQVKSN